MTKTSLYKRFIDLASLTETASTKEKQQRGQKLELLLRDLFELEGLSPRTRFRPEGEEIDGSFVHNGKTYLLEAKWHNDPLPASSIYQFKGKVDGKLVGTVGIFISMSGYSKDAVDALTLGKTLNVILFDRSDIEYSLSEDTTFKHILETRLRYAAEEGSVYFPFKSKQLRFDPKTRETQSQDVSTEQAISAPSPSKKQPSSTTKPPDAVIICEGHTDELVLRHLIERVLASRQIAQRIQIVRAMGKWNIPHLANIIGLGLSESSKLIIVSDADNDLAGTIQKFKQELKTNVHAMIIPEPEIEAWLVPGATNPHKTLRSMAAQKHISPLAMESELLNKIDIAQLEQTDNAFAQLVAALTN